MAVMDLLSLVDLNWYAEFTQKHETTRINSETQIKVNHNLKVSKLNYLFWVTFLDKS